MKKKTKMREIIEHEMREKSLTLIFTVLEFLKAMLQMMRRQTSEILSSSS